MICAETGRGGVRGFLLSGKKVSTGRFELPSLATYASETYAYTNSATCSLGHYRSNWSLFKAHFSDNLSVPNKGV